MSFGRYWILAILAGFFIVATPRAQALTISPARHQLAAAPGTSHILIVRVTNTESTEKSLALGVVGASQDEDGRPLFAIGKDRAEGWLAPAVPVITVPPRQTREARFLLQIPADAEPGSPHYLGLTVAPAAAPGATVGLAVQAASLVELQITGVVREALAIKQWSVLDSLQLSGRWNFILALENTGTVSLPLAGQVVLRSWRGKFLGEAPLPLGNRLLAHATRRLAPTVAAGSLARLPGWYRAEAVVRHGATGQEARATTSVWYLPAAIVTPAIIILLGLAAVAVRSLIKRRRGHKMGSNQLFKQTGG